MSQTVIDSAALLAYFRDTQGAEIVQKALERAVARGVPITMTDYSYAEMITQVLANDGAASVNAIKKAMLSLPITTVGIDRKIAEQGAMYSNRYSLNLSTALALAAASARRAELLSGDKQLTRGIGDTRVTSIS